ncbi:MAG: dihydroxyacetone kinase subunit DhaK [Actinomyces sp.]|uniref:dihydroxyacetone kinase subunit DhaK n=1 Tax=Actinomyces sp. TaxID=29317 RepID=UPI0026DACB72|nr:dihydroxyacetone kinase subunit DhaK [Actinomyces sp.]MDO4243290.1 dihydroxyacetone kinase subunit DhaK [Actinomyces sp.]
MKKLINSAETVVSDALAGMAAAHPGVLSVDLDQRVVYRAVPKEQGRVAIVSGGGSGHEPLHGGFVGAGMLDAACAGEIFTSPVPDQIAAATAAVDRGAGVLHIVKNYTGDIMNFEMAAELVAAESGTQVATVVTADDVAVEDSLYTAGRRGVGVTVIVEKIAGAAAEEGRPLAEVAAVAERVSRAGRSMGMALTSCTVPANGKPSFDLPEEEMEIGIGIHGEPGRHREPVAPADQIAARLVEPLLAELPEAPAGEDHGVIALLNGMGASPLIELYVVYAEVARLLQEAGVAVARRLVGNYITSLDMAGCSLTLVRADAEMLRLWDAPVSTPGLRWGA